MDTQRWELAGNIFERLLGTPQDQRNTMLDSLCGDDAELKHVVASMLDSESSALHFEEGLGVKRDGADSTTDADALPPTEPVGPWRLVKKIGSGGMGVVWLAERADGQFEQRAALKLIKRGMDSEAVLKRFLRERQILARLTHAHIAHLLDGGIAADGRPYFAMEYVEGLPLLRYCHERGVTLEQRIRLFVDVCAAVQFAHTHHVVHRDLKPSNILVTDEGGVKLLDFGIAKLLEGDAAGTDTITHLQRERPMTPAYAAPEQISGGKISEATDIYALGCVLYELLTGQRVRDFSAAANVNDVLRIIESTDPVAPSRLKLATPPVPSKRLRGDLDTIVLTALKRAPRHRYPSAAAFATDLKKYLGGNPITARRDSVFYRGYKFARRHRSGLAALATVAVIAVAVLIIELRERLPASPVAPGSSLAVVDFNNLSQQPAHAWLATALAEMLSTRLVVGSALHAVPDELVRPARADLAAPLAGGYAARSLATLRKRLGVDYVVSGSYLVSGNAADAKLHLDLALQDARTGAALGSVSESGALSDLPAMVNTAGANLRERGGFQPASAQEQKQFEKAEPPNIEVARRMGLALEALRKSDAAKARDELLDAVAIAPAYAPAYALLAQAWKALGYDAKALAAAQQAAAHSEGLPQTQRLSIAHEVAAPKGDWEHALDLDRQLLGLEPNNPEWHMMLVRDLRDAGQIDRAKAALADWRKLPGSSEDPRVDLEAAQIASAGSDLDAALKLAERALTVARQRDNTGLAARAKVTIVSTRDYLGDRRGAEAMLAEAADEYRRIGNPKGEADAHLMLAIVLDEENKGSESRREFQRALEIYEGIGHQAGMALVYDNLTRMLWRQGDPDAAIRAAERALAISVERGDVSAQASATNAIAVAHLDESAGDTVVQELRHAIDLGQRAGDLRLRLIATRNLADALRLRGELGRAHETCDQARALAQQLNEPYTTASVGMSCGEIALDRGDVSGAYHQLEAVLQAAVESRDLSRQAQVQTELVWIDMRRGSAADCDTLRNAADAAARAENVTVEANARAMLALCLAMQNRMDESGKEAGLVRELRSRVTAHLEVSLADLVLAQLPGFSGKPSDRSAAITALGALAEDANRRSFIANALEAGLAQQHLMEQTHSPTASVLRAQLRAAADAHGFAWLLARL